MNRGPNYFWLTPFFNWLQKQDSNLRREDCKLLRHKYLISSFHKEPMGGGIGATATPGNPEWKYPNPNSVKELILKSICSR